MAQLTLENLSFSYPDSRQKALDGVNLAVERGELLTLMGPTGSGKSTLLRLLKPELWQNGELEGRVLYEGADITALPASESAAEIGYVAQNPEEQLVTDKVWHELAFTMENLGAKRADIARRIAEIAAFFDIENLLDRDTATLSGGQKQLVNLAAVMTADPALLLLDEPTAQLDPIAAARFIDALRRLNRETGLTVIISEHRAEELLPVSDRLLLLDGGRPVYLGSPRQAVGIGEAYVPFLPAAARLFAATGGRGETPLSVREGMRYVGGFDNTIRSLAQESGNDPRDPALELNHLYFRYEREGADVLCDLSLTVYRGEVLAILGPNGAGKSTAAAVAAGLRRPYSGTVRLFGKRLRDYKNGSLYRGGLSLLPQDTGSVFLCDTVGEELKGCEAVADGLPFDLHPLYDRHPYDLSGGERQLVALCKALSTDPRLLILDEPSKGLDARAKKRLCEVIAGLKQRGVTVLLISHDVEFAALCADRCALFSQGRIAAVDRTERFMSGNRFYTTAASRITRGVYDGAYTVERAARLIAQNGGGHADD